jgi:hypothetical protein
MEIEEEPDGRDLFNKIDGLVKSHAASFNKIWLSMPKELFTLSTKIVITLKNRSLKGGGGEQTQIISRVLGNRYLLLHQRPAPLGRSPSIT